MLAEHVYLLIKEPGADKVRLVRAPRIPFKLGNVPDADIRIGGASDPVQLRFSLSGGEYRVHMESGTDSAAPTRGVRLRHGSRLKTSGVRLQFLTRAPRVKRSDRPTAPARDRSDYAGVAIGAAPWSPAEPHAGVNGPPGGVAPDPAAYHETSVATAVLTRSEEKEESTRQYRAEEFSAPARNALVRQEEEPVDESKLPVLLEKARSYLRTLDRLREKLDAPPDFLHS